MQINNYHQSEGPYTPNFSVKERDRKLDAFAAVFQKVCRIMSGKLVFVRWVVTLDPQLQQIAGWTDGKTVSLNRRLIGEKVIKAPYNELVRLMASLTGVIYHELSHVIYTPRNDEAGMPSVIAEATQKGELFFQCWNVLEDQRIEYLFSAAYTPVEKYFQLMALEWVIANATGHELGRAYPLLYGRSYLPYEIREESRRLFAANNGESVTLEVESIIDEYIQLNVWVKHIKMLGLVRRLWKLLTTLPSRDYTNEVPQVTGGHSKAPDREDASARKDKRPIEMGEVVPASKDATSDKNEKATKAAIHKAQQRDDEAYESIDADFPGGDGEGEEGEGEGSPSQGDGDGEKDAPGVSNSQTNTGTNAAPDPIQIAKDAIDELLKDEDLLREVDDTIKAAHVSAQGSYITIAAPSDFRKMPAEGALMVARNHGVDILRSIKTELEPVWEQGAYTGRLNMEAVMARGVDPSRINVFDAWNEGIEEEIGLEVCIALDLSGSMVAGHPKSHLQNACEAMWAIRSMCEAVDIDCTVFGFGTGVTTLFGPNDRAEKNHWRLFRTYGDTNPSGSCIESRRIFQSSRQPNKVFICITDGAWGMEESSSHAQIRAMGAEGVITSMLSLGQSNGAHGCMMHTFLADSSLVTTYIKQLVIAVTRRAAGKR